MVSEEAELIRIRVQLTGVFSPSAPVSKKELFAGRLDQITQVISAVSQVGQHVVLYGERGVGKTSLASLVYDFWNDVFKDESAVVAPRVNCDTTDTFESLWAKIAEEVEMEYAKRNMPFPRNGGAFENAFEELVHEAARPNTVRRFLELYNNKLIIIIDEFDRLQDDEALRLIADTIKTLSDHLVETTLVIVGVADSVDDLIREHASIDRALVQVLVPRMSIEELKEIVQTRLERVGMEITDEALGCIVEISQGLPHYTHLLGLHSGLAAIQNKRRRVQFEDAMAALNTAVDKAHESIRTAYHKATTSPRRENLFRQVLLACALTPVDDLGYFAPADVRAPMSRIMQKRYDIPAFIRHLNALCTEDRGRILQKTGPERKQRFRFVDPLMKPYIVLRGLAEQMIDSRILSIVPRESQEHPST